MFDLFPWSRQAVVVLRSSFRHSRLEAVRTIGDAVDGDGPERPPLERFSVAKTEVGLVSNQGLKGLEDLKRRLEAEGSRWDPVPAGRLCHERADQVVGQDVCPDLLPDQFRCLAPEHVHLERDLDRSQVEFIVPPRPIECGQIRLGRLLGVQQGRHDDDRPGPESGLCHANPSLSDRDQCRE